MASDITSARPKDSVSGVVVVDHSVDMYFPREMRADINAGLPYGIDVSDEWTHHPFVVARRLAGELVAAAPLAGDVAVVAIGERARFVEPVGVPALTMDVFYGTN